MSEKLQAIKKKLNEFVDIEGKKRKLTFKQHAFAEAYLALRGDGAGAARQAEYSVHTAKMIAHQQLQNPDVIAYLQMRIDDLGYNDQNVNAQHSFLINQFADLAAKAKGIDMYRKVKGQYAPERVKIEDEFDDYSDEEIEDELAKRVAVAGKRRGAKAGAGKTAKAKSV